MANIDNPNGLRPFNVSPKKAYEAGVTTAIFQGDVVQMGSGGRVKSITTTTGNLKVIGVAANYIPAATTPAVTVWVYADPNDEFIIQDDGAGVTTSDINDDLIGETAPLILTTGNTGTGLSKQEMDISGAAASTTHAIKVVGVYRDVKNEEGTANRKWIVKIDRHFYKGGVNSAV